MVGLGMYGMYVYVVKCISMVTHDSVCTNKNEPMCIMYMFSKDTYNCTAHVWLMKLIKINMQTRVEAPYVYIHKIMVPSACAKHMVEKQALP